MLQIDKKVKGFFANTIDDLDFDERHVSVALGALLMDVIYLNDECLRDLLEPYSR